MSCCGDDSRKFTDRIAARISIWAVEAAGCACGSGSSTPPVGVQANLIIYLNQ